MIDDAESGDDRWQPTSLPIQFGKYRLIEHIARGGMGEVYLASLSGEFGFEKPLVVKLIRPELASQERFVALFAAEANTAVALEHPNIVPIYELGRTEDGALYIAMGRVDGPSLHDYLAALRRRGEPPDPSTALFIVREVLEGLAHAHNPGRERPPVVHRDVSTRNVLLDRSGRALIVDFGIAMPAHETVQARMGSAGYMAPEQARAAEVDPRADVFSVGCILYELLTHERAFPKEGVWSPPDLERVPAPLRGLLERMISVDPAARPRTAGVCLRELGPLLAEHNPAYGSQDLARAIARADPGGEPEGTTDSEPPSTRSTRVTTPFATRLTPIPSTAEPAPLPPPSQPAEPPPPPARRLGLAVGALGLLGLLGLLGIAALAFVLVRDGSTARVERASDSAPAARDDAGARAPASRATEEAKATTVPREAAPPTASLIVSAPAARVRIGDTSIPGPPFTITLGEEPVEVTVTADGHLPRTLTLAAEDAGAVPVELVRAGKGALTVTAPEVDWAEVLLDGKRLGQTPLVDQPIAAGPHKIAVRCSAEVCGERKLLVSKRIEISAGKTVQVVASGR